MKTAIDLRSLIETGGKISGVENYLINILDNFPEREAGEKAGVKDEYFGFYNSYKKVKLPSFGDFTIKFSRIPNKVFNSLLRLFNLPKFESLYGSFDWLWLPDIRPFAIRKNTKLALTIHDLSAFMHPEFYSLKRRIWHRFVNYKKAVKRADIIFAVSEYTKTDLIRVLKVPEEKIKVIYPGIDSRRFRTDLDERLMHKVKDKYNLPENFILSLSTVEPRKNLVRLIEAYEKNSDRSLYLIIAGRLGWIYEDFLKRAEASPKKNKIRILSYVSEEDKPYLISLSKIVCYPSFYEGFGFVPLEAMACGVPVITSARTSMPEVCGNAALLVEPYNLNDLASAIEVLNTDSELRKKMIERGLKRVKNFTWEKTVQEIKQSFI